MGGSYSYLIGLESVFCPKFGEFTSHEWNRNFMQGDRYELSADFISWYFTFSQKRLVCVYNENHENTIFSYCKPLWFICKVQLKRSGIQIGIGKLLPETFKVNNLLSADPFSCIYAFFCRWRSFVCIVALHAISGTMLLRHTIQIGSSHLMSFLSCPRWIFN